MYVKYDEEKLRRTLAFLKWDFINGKAIIEIDENGNMHFCKTGGLKLFSIENLQLEKSEFIDKKPENVFTLPEHA